MHSKEKVKEVSKAFIKSHKYLNKYRLHKLVFLTDIILYYKNKQTLEINYKPYMHGVYSEDLSSLVDIAAEEDQDIKILPDYNNGKMQKRYASYGNDISKIDLPNYLKDIIEKVTEATKTKTNKQMEIWSKNTSLYEETSYNDCIRFNNYGKDDLSEDVFSEFSSLEDV